MHVPRYAGLALCAVMVLQTPACRKAEAPLRTELPERVLVRVNGHPVTNQQVERRIASLYGDVDLSTEDPVLAQRLTEQAVEAQIMDTLLLQAAMEEDLVVTDDEVAREVDRTRSLMGEETFARMLEKRGVDRSAFADFLRERMLIMRFKERLWRDISVDESTLRDYYDGHADRLRRPERARLHIVVVDDGTKADVMHSDVLAGGDFDVMASRHAEGGGRVSRTRPMPLDEIPDGLRELVSAAEAGETVRFDADDGKTYLVRVLEKLSAGMSTFEEARDEIENSLLQVRRQKFLDDWYENQAKGAVIEYVRD